MEVSVLGGGEYDFDSFEFGLDTDDDELTVDTPKRQKRDGGIVANKPMKRDIRRYMPQMLVNVINTTDFSKLLTFFDTFMSTDARYTLEYLVPTRIIDKKISNFCESQGPELTAFMFMGYGAMFPDMVLTANEVTICSNNFNSTTTITMDCSHNFTRIYDVTLDWTLAQLQGLFRASQPNPHKDLKFHSNLFSINQAVQKINATKPYAKAGKTAKSTKTKKSDKKALTIGSKSYDTDASEVGSTNMQLTQLSLSNLDQAAGWLKNNNSQNIGSGGSTKSNISSIGSSSRCGSTSGSECGSATKVERGGRSNGYDLSPLVHSIFKHAPVAAKPKPVYCRCVYNIVLEGTRITSLHVTTETLPPPKVQVAAIM